MVMRKPIVVRGRRSAKREKARAEFAALHGPPITPAHYRQRRNELKASFLYFMRQMVADGQVPAFKQMHIEISEPATGVTEIYIMTV
jgi:hypothetical protein